MSPLLFLLTKMTASSKPIRLNQIVATAKEIQSRGIAKITELYHACQKPMLFGGMTRRYQKKNEEGEEYPNENHLVQMKADDVLKDMALYFGEIFDVCFARDKGNCVARANVEIGDQVLIENAPVPFLIFMEKELHKLRTYIEKVPVLDSAEDWSWDESTGLFKTSEAASHRTQKVISPLVIVPATKEFQAQATTITEDKVVGTWYTIKFSGAIPAVRQRALLERLNALSKAVKQAREAANMIEVKQEAVGRKIFDYILS